jgi:DNA-binding MarR family transcriptional regulator
MAGLFNRLQDELDSREQQDGISPIDLLDLPPALATIIKQIVRKNGMKLADIAKALNQSPEKAQKALDELVDKGYVRRVEVKEDIWYKAFFRRKADKPIGSGVWAALDGLVEEDDEKPN